MQFPITRRRQPESAPHGRETLAGAAYHATLRGLLNEAAGEIERLRLSDEQAWAIEYAAKLAFKENNGGFVADCLRRLLKEKETFPQVK